VALDEPVFVPFSKLFQSASAFVPLEPEAPAHPSRLAGIEEEQVETKGLEVVPRGPAHEGSLQAVTHAAAPPPAFHEVQRNREIVDLLRSEMAALRREFSLSRQMQPWQDGLQLAPAIRPLVLAMSDAAVPTGLRGLLTDSIQSLDNTTEAMAVMHDLLTRSLVRDPMAIPNRGVHAICGPSGAGKTAMVGRLAFAAAQLEGAERQAMISFADQRPGAWSQMQMLASQAGVPCYRAMESDTLQALLADLEGKTVWIDTSGADFLGQAELLLQHHPRVIRHAVLPVDATVTSVQKILQHPRLTWTSLMLSKWDEAASPWALIKGLTENPLPVSCVSEDVRISCGMASFDPDRLAQLALLPLASLAPQLEAQLALAPAGSLGVSVLPPTPPKKRGSARSKTTVVKPTAALKAKPSKSLKAVDMLTPALMAATSAPRSRGKAVNASSALKVVNG
jgi:flagellar biosynthesis GTPase FlhF